MWIFIAFAVIYLGVCTFCFIKSLGEQNSAIAEHRKPQTAHEFRQELIKTKRHELGEWERRLGLAQRTSWAIKSKDDMRAIHGYRPVEDEMYDVLRDYEDGILTEHEAASLVSQLQDYRKHGDDGGTWVSSPVGGGLIPLRAWERQYGKHPWVTGR